MSSRQLIGRSLFFILTLGILLISIPAVIFANSSTGAIPNQIDPDPGTIPNRTPVPASWLPVIANQPTLVPTPTFTPFPTNTPACSGPQTDPTDAALEIVMQAKINEQRTNNGGLAGYTVNQNLVQAARRHAKDMGNLSDAQLGSDPHRGSDGTSASTRISDACYTGSRETEIVGWGFSSLDTMIDWWMNSSIHRSIILKTDIDEYGPTYMNLPGTQYTHYWTVTFGNSTGSRASEDLYQCHYVVQEEDRGISAIVWQDTPCK